MFKRVCRGIIMLLFISLFFSGCSPVGISNPAVGTDTYLDSDNAIETIGQKVYESEKIEAFVDSKEELLKTMEIKYKLYKKAWRVNEREEHEEPLEHFVKYAKTAVTGYLLQEGVDFFSGPPQGYASSLKERLLEANVKSRTSDRAVISSVWEEETVGDGIHFKEVSNVTIKLKKAEEVWLISDLKYELVSQEELEDPINSLTGSVSENTYQD